jgi:hypothetical protein
MTTRDGSKRNVVPDPLTNVGDDVAENDLSEPEGASNATPPDMTAAPAAESERSQPDKPLSDRLVEAVESALQGESDAEQLYALNHLQTWLTERLGEPDVDASTVIEQVTKLLDTCHSAS